MAHRTKRRNHEDILGQAKVSFLLIVRLQIHLTYTLCDNSGMPNAGYSSIRIDQKTGDLEDLRVGWLQPVALYVSLSDSSLQELHQGRSCSPLIAQHLLRA